MACVINRGREEACKDSISGLSSVFFFNNGEASFTIDQSTGCVIDIDDGAGGPVNCYKYVSRHNSSLETTITADPAAGTVLYDQLTTVNLKRLDAQTSVQVKLLAWGTPQIVCHANSGKAWLTGAFAGNDLNGGTLSTGVAKADFSGYNLTFLAQEKAPPFEIVGATESDPFAGMPNVNVIAGVAGGGGTANITNIAESGTYTAGTPLDLTNFITLTVDVSSAGTFDISSDIVNGYQFKGTLETGCSGINTIVMFGQGTPLVAGLDSFTLTALTGVITGTTTFDITVV